MSRIHFAAQDGSGWLQRILAGYLRHAIEELPVDPQTIFEIVVAGNPAMRDLFFSLDVQSLGQGPYHSLTEREMAAGRRTTTSLTESATKLHLPAHPRARAYGLPIVGSHVGADTAADLLAIDLAGEERTVALMDIGTNTELVLGNQHKIFAASCPAGPAFEGGRIACGMSALAGAIEKARINPDGSVQMEIIGSGPAEGLCGSGLVDLLGELIRTGRINPLGRFLDGSDRFVLPGRSGAAVYLTEADINELAQAKGANAAGLRVIFDRFGIGFQELDVLYLAGGFGRNLNLESARRIGLIPNLPDAKIRQIGNAAIEGATIALLFRAKRAQLEGLVRSVTHCPLETHENFFNYFVDGCQFRPLESAPAAPAARPCSN
jgi:uncharacterized 2Fe-2S/4Fe-4S cluster protein (DUF4445 family)